jgi:hypothetical protein
VGRPQDNADILPNFMEAGDVDLYKATEGLLHVGQDLTHARVLSNKADGGFRMQQSSSNIRRTINPPVITINVTTQKVRLRTEDPPWIMMTPHRDDIAKINRSAQTHLEILRFSEVRRD